MIILAFLWMDPTSLNTTAINRIFLLHKDYKEDHKCPKNYFELNLEEILFMCVDDWGKNRFWSNLPKN